MGVIGFNYTKIEAEKNPKVPAKGGIEVKHNVSIKEVEKTSLNVAGGKSDVLRIVFNFDVLYGNSLGKVSLEGDVIYTDTKEIVEETFKNWEDKKDLTDMVKESVHRFVYNKCIVKAIEISDNVSLPSPVPLPKIASKASKK